MWFDLTEHSSAWLGERLPDGGQLRERSFWSRSLNVHRLFTECSLNVHWMFTECSLNVEWMPFDRILSLIGRKTRAGPTSWRRPTSWTLSLISFTECSPIVHWMFIQCSLSVHWMLNECHLTGYWAWLGERLGRGRLPDGGQLRERSLRSRGLLGGHPHGRRVRGITKKKCLCRCNRIVVNIVGSYCHSLTAAFWPNPTSVVDGRMCRSLKDPLRKIRSWKHPKHPNNPNKKPNNSKPYKTRKTLETKTPNPKTLRPLNPKTLKTLQRKTLKTTPPNPKTLNPLNPKTPKTLQVKH
jgi:hypothetical protein